MMSGLHFPSALGFKLCFVLSKIYVGPKTVRVAIKSMFCGQYRARLTSPSWLIFWMILTLAAFEPYEPISAEVQASAS